MFHQTNGLSTTAPASTARYGPGVRSHRRCAADARTKPASESTIAPPASLDCITRPAATPVAGQAQAMPCVAIQPRSIVSSQKVPSGASGAAMMPLAANAGTT